MNYKKIITFINRGLRYVFLGIPMKEVRANIVKLSNNELLKDRYAIITGGTSGIGFAIAQSMLEAGAYVIITGRNQKRLDESADKLKSLNKSFCDKIFTQILDNLNIDSIDDCIEKIQSKINYNKISILVNNAGIIGNELKDSEHKEIYEKVLDTNLKSSYFLSKKIATYMIDNKIQGNILNIISASSLRPAISPYQLSKWGLRGMTMGFAKMLAPYDIIVNAIAPGPTATKMLKIENNENIGIDNPLGRMTTPEEIANMAVILTSDMGKSTLGSVVYMTGGSGLLTYDDISYDL